MNILHTIALMSALIGLIVFSACGQDSDIGSPCRFQSTFSVPFPPDAILEDSKECSTGTCMAYEGGSYLVYSHTRAECEAMGWGSCAGFPPAEHFERYVYCTCRCPDECACDGDGIECRTVETSLGEEDLCVRTR